jgi:DNA (cytosine-5)-methyltransferase 1
MHKFRFIDLFAGIGGFHLALHQLGGECVFASEIDEHARTTYEHNFKKISPDLFEKGLFNADIRSISPNDIPDFDILCAGFPCQPFSQAGHKRGFTDSHKSERGNLFFNIVDILEAKKPQAFFLENVRGIVNHDDGNTFKVIRKYLENELGYSFYFKVVKASEYGLPQLRPRAFMIGFRDEGLLRGFSFPQPLPLKFNMSDVWGGSCTREIGFTIRVGGRRSPITDRRNWDSYIVDGSIKVLGVEQGKKMQGFPETFEFPVRTNQAMKQLGNSVAVDAVYATAKSLVGYMEDVKSRGAHVVKKTKNKGEWTELYSFLKFLAERKLELVDEKLQPTGSSFNVSKVSTLNMNNSYVLTGSDTVVIEDEESTQNREISVKELLSPEVLKVLADRIKNGSGTFEIDDFDVIKDTLGISVVKGGNSLQKADIILDIQNDEIEKNNEGFGIKSYLGSKPTLLNASGGNTNFIYRIENLAPDQIDIINSIDTRTKLRDRLQKITSLGGSLVFERLETDTMTYNLSLVDSSMPRIVAEMLLEYYMNRTSSLHKNVEQIHNHGTLLNDISYGDSAALIVKVKRLLVAVMFGLFTGHTWDGKYTANGTVVVKEDGDQVGFHIIDLGSLEEYLFNTIRFDTPSTTRHRFGQIIHENDGKLYFKLNLQLRF